jgi:hypothetical protein
MALKQRNSYADYDFMSNTEPTLVESGEHVVDLANDGSKVIPAAPTSLGWDGLENREVTRRTTDSVHRRDAVWVTALVVRSAAAVLLVKFSPPIAIICAVTPLSIGLSIAVVKQSDLARAALGVVREVFTPPQAK